MNLFKSVFSRICQYPGRFESVTQLIQVFGRVVVVVVSHIQRIGCQPEKLLYTVANPARGLLNRGKRTEKKVWQPPPLPPPPHAARSEKIK